MTSEKEHTREETDIIKCKEQKQLDSGSLASWLWVPHSSCSPRDKKSHGSRASAKSSIVEHILQAQGVK